MEKFGRTQTWLLFTYSAKSLGKTHFTVLTLGTTFSGGPSIFTDLAGLSNFTKRVSSTSFPRPPLWDVQPAINPFWPLVMHNSVTSLFLIITGTPLQRGSLSGKWAVAAWGRFHMRSCNQGLIALEECLLVLLDFLPLCFFSDTSGEFPKWSTEWKWVKVWFVSAAKCLEPSSLILSFWAFKDVMIDAFWKSLAASFGWSGRLPAILVFKKLMSSGVQALYFIMQYS